MDSVYVVRIFQRGQTEFVAKASLRGEELDAEFRAGNQPYAFELMLNWFFREKGLQVVTWQLVNATPGVLQFWVHTRPAGETAEEVALAALSGALTFPGNRPQPPRDGTREEGSAFSRPIGGTGESALKPAIGGACDSVVVVDPVGDAASRLGRDR